MMLRDIRKINKFQQDDYEIVIADVAVNSSKVNFVEYYVGVDRGHPAYRRGVSFRNDKVTHEIFEAGKETNVEELVGFLNDTINLSKDEKAEYIKKSGYKAMDGAWISFLGNKEEYSSFLTEGKCYYGGGMYIPHFGYEECRSAAIEASAKIINYLNKEEQKHESERQGEVENA